MMDLTYQKAVDNADALKALGQLRVYLYGDDDERPWEFVINSQPGGRGLGSYPASGIAQRQLGLPLLVSLGVSPMGHT